MLKLAHIAVIFAVTPLCFPASLTYSTYLRDGFTPTALTSDGQGNLYLAGLAVTDPASRASSVAIAKLDPKAGRYLYFTLLDAPATDDVSSIAVDPEGNLFVTGTTTNPDFPTATSSFLGTQPLGPTDNRAFVIKLSPNGVVLLSTLIGGSVASRGLGIAVGPRGQILVSGISGAGFAATPGAFSVSDTTNQWFLTELDAAAAKVIFSATGVGGRFIALDASGNIFLAGSSVSTTYPTTAGAYQTTFVQGYTCYGFCRIGFPGELQHLTKLDPTGTKLMYSTGINDPSGGAGSTVTTGLAVDADGNAYISGTLLEGRYPLTTIGPIPTTHGFVSKVDPSGSSLRFSIPVGGAGIRLDPSGAIYTAGTVSTANPVGFPGLTAPVVVRLPDGLSSVPQACYPNTLTATEGAYALKLDPLSGDIQDAQWIDGTSVTAVASTFASSKFWVTGISSMSDVPITPGALAATKLTPGPLAGAFLSAAEFSASPSSASQAPIISCVLDASNLIHAGPVAAYQILAIFGSNLGPDPGIAAPDGSDSIAGVTVTFDGHSASLTYVSASQINVLVPAPVASPNVTTYPSATVMRISVNGASTERQFPVAVYNLNLFAELANVTPSCPSTAQGTLGFQVIALDSSGNRISCTSPARFGSLVSVFVDGVGAQQIGLPMPDSVPGIAARIGVCDANVENVTRTSVVYKVDVRLPATLLPCAENAGSDQIKPLLFSLTYHGLPAGPLLPNPAPTRSNPVRSQSIFIWVTQ